MNYEFSGPVGHGRRRALGQPFTPPSARGLRFEPPHIWQGHPWFPQPIGPGGLKPPSASHLKGFGQLPGDDGCPPLSSRFGIPGGPCFPFFGAGTSPDCPAGSTPLPDPMGSGVFICMPQGAPPPVPVPVVDPSATACPPGSAGMPPFCFTMPAIQPPPAPVPGAACPAGTLGIPPVCIPVQQPPAPSTCPPGQSGSPPNCQPNPVPVPVPVPVPGPTPAPAAQAAAPLPGWVLPVGIGVAALAAYAIFKPKRRATANRGRHAYR